MKMTYTLGCNFDTELIDFVAENDKLHQITSFFGKLKQDIVGGGRSSNVLPEVSLSTLKTYIAKCKHYGIGFNYLLNPMCMTLSQSPWKLEVTAPGIVW